MINLKNYHNRNEVLLLLAACMYPDAVKINAALAAYENQDNRLFLGKVHEGELLGLIGIIQHEYTELKHIA
jgi:hypothetical protein